jgi:hypothetical protein
MCLVRRSYHLSPQKHVSAIVHRASPPDPPADTVSAQVDHDDLHPPQSARAIVAHYNSAFFYHEASQVINSFSCTMYIG